MHIVQILTEDRRCNTLFRPVYLEDINQGGKLHRGEAFWGIAMAWEYMKISRKLKKQGLKPVLIFRQKDFKDPRPHSTSVMSFPYAFAPSILFVAHYIVEDLIDADNIHKDFNKDLENTLGVILYEQSMETARRKNPLRVKLQR